MQFYNNTGNARRLLARWHETVMASAGIADDECLNFTFNNPTDESNGAKACWLPKSHCRHAWWIYQKPAINHPDFPNDASGFASFPEAAPRRAFYRERALLTKVEPHVAPGLLIDTWECQIIKNREGRLKPVGPVPFELWL